MNGLDFLLLLGILTLTGGAILIALGRLRSTRVSLQRARGAASDGSFHLRQQAVRRGEGKASSQAAGPDAGRLAALKRKFTITRARSESAPPSPAQSPATLSHITQCPEDSFWKDLQTPRNRPEA